MNSFKSKVLVLSSRSGLKVADLQHKSIELASRQDYSPQPLRFSNDNPVSDVLRVVLVVAKKHRDSEQ